MAPLPVIPDIHRVAITYHNNDTSFANVINVRIDPTSGATPLDIATDIMHAWHGTTTPNLLNMQANSITMDAVTSTPLDGTSVSATSPFPASTIGTGTGLSVSAQTAFVMSLKTAVRGRSNRGRFYLGGVVAGVLNGDGSLWTATGLADYLTRFSNFMTDALTPGNIASFGVASYKLATFRDLAEWDPKAKLGTIRKRAERAV